MPALAPGQTIRGLRAGYTVERVLGEGGFGVAFLARRDDGEAVVLKQLRVARMADWKALELFEREARVLAALDHPGVPRLHEFFALDGDRARAPSALGAAADPSLVLAQAYVEGRSLQQWVDEGGRWGAEDAEAVLRRLLGVLHYLHTRHPPVIHRDIKPSNVILGPGGAAHLVDFGAIQDRLRGDTSLGSTSVGSFGFFPIEQVLGKARPASDLYALGMTMMVALTHRPPEALPLDERTSKVLVRAAAPHLPARLAAALEAMLEPAVGQRVATAEAALTLLDGAALARTDATSLERREPAVHPAVWRVPIVTGGVSAAAIYGVWFDQFSETELVLLSFLWLPQVVFGLALRSEAHRLATRRPVARALGWTALGMLALLLFFAAVFPAL
jgi:serine/threonine protein kinase